MSHTPGPWKVSRNVTPREFCTDTKIRDSRDGVIAVMHVNADANARLIAAAPAMLQALQSVLFTLEQEGDSSVIAPAYRAHLAADIRAAIRAATRQD